MDNQLFSTNKKNYPSRQYLLHCQHVKLVNTNANGAPLFWMRASTGATRANATRCRMRLSLANEHQVAPCNLCWFDSNKFASIIFPVKDSWLYIPLSFSRWIPTKEDHVQNICFKVRFWTSQWICYYINSVECAITLTMDLSNFGNTRWSTHYARVQIIA